MIYPCEPKQTPPTHLHHWFIVVVRLWVIPSAFAWVITSSGTWGSLWLWISCYSWCLPPPRWLEAAEELWHKLVIVHGWLPSTRVGDCFWPALVIVRGLAPSPAKSQKVALVDCSCHWVTSLVGRFLRCPNCVDEVCATPLSRRTTKCWSTQRGCSVLATTWTSGENWLSLAIWYSPVDWIIIIHLVIGSLLYTAV